MTDEKRRHGCLTAWLVVMIVASALTAVIYLVGGELLGEALPDMPGWVFSVFIVLAVFNLVCAIALWRWKMWGFWGICASTIITLVINLSLGLGIAASSTGLLGLALLYGVLQIGTDNKGWPQLD